MKLRNDKVSLTNCFSVIDHVNNILKINNNYIYKCIENKLNDTIKSDIKATIDSITISSVDEINSVSSSYKLNKYFTENLNYVDPVEILLGYVNSNKITY